MLSLLKSPWSSSQAASYNTCRRLLRSITSMRQVTSFNRQTTSSTIARSSSSGTSTINRNKSRRLTMKTCNKCHSMALSALSRSKGRPRGVDLRTFTGCQIQRTLKFNKGLLSAVKISRLTTEPGSKASLTSGANLLRFVETKDLHGKQLLSFLLLLSSN